MWAPLFARKREIASPWRAAPITITFCLNNLFSSAHKCQTKSQHGADQLNEKKAHHDLVLFPADHLKMMMDWGFLKNTLTASCSEIEHLDDYAEHFSGRNDCNQRQEQPAPGHERDHCQGGTQSLRAGIAHVEGGRFAVEPQKSSQGTDNAETKRPR